MYQFPKETLAAICDAPDNFLTGDWETGYHKLLAYMGANHPEWTEGVKVVKDEGTFVSSGNQYREYLRNLVNKGVKLEVGNCMSYWFIRTCRDLETQVAKYVTLEYVSHFGGEWIGHGIEYFSPDAAFSVFGALRRRVKMNKTTECSHIGYATAEDAIAMFGTVGVQSWI